MMKLFLCASALSLSTLFASCAPNTAATSSISSEDVGSPSITVGSTPANTVSVPVSVFSESFDQLETSALQDHWRTEIGDVQRKGKYFDGPGEVDLSVTGQSFDGASGKALSLNYGLLLCSGTYPKINRKNGCDRHADAALDFSSEQKSKMNLLPTISAKLKLSNSVVKFRSNGTYRNEDLKPLDGNAVLSLEVTDSKGNIFAYQLPNVKNDWQSIRVDLNDAPTSRRGNSSSASLVMPLRSMAMVVNQPGSKGFDEAVGYLLIDDLNITSTSTTSSGSNDSASMPAPSNQTSFEFARFGESAALSLQGGTIYKTAYSERPGDAQVQNVSTSNGIATIEYTLSKQNGSVWGGAGLSFTASSGTRTVNVQGFNALRLQIASSPTSRLVVRIAGNNPAFMNTGCYPIAIFDVKPEMKTYTIPLSLFAPADFCDAKAPTISQTINAGVHFVEVYDPSLPDNGLRRGTIKVGTISFVR